MPIFRLEDDTLIIAQETNLELESHLEDWLANSPRQTLGQDDFLWIGRQTSVTDEDSTIFPDLLGIDSEGNLVIVELKKGRSPREVVAQILEYAAWSDGLTDSQIREIAEDYFKNRDEFEWKTFELAFKSVFDIPEADEIPPLNRTLRLFIIAEAISERVARVCRFLRTSHGMDISCIDVSTYQTKDGEKLVSMETKVGDEQFTVPNKIKKQYSSSKLLSGDVPEEQLVMDAVQEFTKGDPNSTFKLRDIEQVVTNNHPDFDKKKVRRFIRGSCVDFPSRNNYTIREDRYRWISKDKYCLFHPGNMNVWDDDKTDLTNSVTE